MEIDKDMLNNKATGEMVKKLSLEYNVYVEQFRAKWYFKDNNQMIPLLLKVENEWTLRQTFSEIDK